MCQALGQGLGSGMTKRGSLSRTYIPEREAPLHKRTQKFQMVMHVIKKNTCFLFFLFIKFLSFS